MKAKLRIRNFKNLEDVTIEIKPLTLLFGPNGSGKSSILKALFFFLENSKKIISEKRKSGIIYKEPLTAIDYSFPQINLDLGKFSEVVSNNDINKSIIFDLFISVDRAEMNLPEYEEYAGKKYTSIDYELDEKDLWVYSKEKETNYPGMEMFFYHHMDFQITTIISNVDKEVTIKNLSDNSYLQYKYPYLNARIKLGEEWLDDLFEKFFTDFYYEIYRDRIEDIPKNYTNGLIKYIYTVCQENKRWELLTPVERKGIYDLIVIKKDSFDGILGLLNKIYSIDYLGGVRDLPKYEFDSKLEDNSTDSYYGIPEAVELDIVFDDIEKSFQDWEKYITKDYEKPELVKKYINTLVQNNRFENIKDSKIEDIWFEDESEFDYISLKNNIAGYTNHFIKELEFGEGIFSFKNEYRKFEVILIDKNGNWTNIKEASSGFQQTLPILFRMTKIVEKKESQNNLGHPDCKTFFLLEQPELHLHPHLQSKLAEIFVKGCHSFDKNILIETHSEHLVRKLQVLFAKGEITHNDLAVYYLDSKNGKTQIKEMQMEENGFFKEPWPDGFFDDSYNLARELIYARKN